MARYPKYLAPALDSIGAPLERTLNVLSARWSFLTLQALADGHVHFNQLNRKLAGINHKVLIETLRLLQENEFVKGPLNGGMATEYQLTALGRELLGWINEIKHWAEERRIAAESCPIVSQRGTAQCWNPLDSMPRPNRSTVH
jgi:DNA-binding HxlR family transcriptional regulator